MNQGSNFDRLNLDKLVASESYYDANIEEALSTVKKDRNIDEALKKIILFCKYVLSVNGNQRKKFLCLKLIKDISQNFKSDLFEKTLDEHIPSKLLKTISSQLAVRQTAQSRTAEHQNEYSKRLLDLAVQTAYYWKRKLSHFALKSSFNDVYNEIKAHEELTPTIFVYYNIDRALTGIFGQKEDSEEEFVKNEEMTPLLSELHDKFNDCKVVITERLNIALENDQELYLLEILDKMRDFLLLFFARYKALEEENSIDRDVLIVYFHIMNTLFKKICNRIYIPTSEMIALTKEIFEGNHSSDFSSVDRMDIVYLAGIQKYNAVTIFRRIHQRIEDEEKKLGVLQFNISQNTQRDKERQKSRDRESLKKASREKLQVKDTQRLIKSSRNILKK